MSTTHLPNKQYLHITMEGTPYEVGRFQGEMLQRNKGVSKFFDAFISGEFSGIALPGGYVELQRMAEEFCPSLNEEIRGFGDSLSIPAEKVPYFAMSFNVFETTQGCSHMAALPSITGDGHVYAGRSYELRPDEEDCCLMTTRIAGKAAHMGFSTVLFGRLDGLNEHGLCVTLSASGVGMPQEPAHRMGFAAWVALRALLENCRDTAEALEMLRRMPVTSNHNLILSDRGGHAALVEMANGGKAVREIDGNSEESYLCSTNHYSLPEMERYLPHMHKETLDFSQMRWDRIRSVMDSEAPAVNRETFRRVLSAVTPEGVCCNYYQYGMGTLWSMIFDLTAREVEVCFGPPTHNGWRTFTLDGPAGVRVYDAHLPGWK